MNILVIVRMTYKHWKETSIYPRHRVLRINLFEPGPRSPNLDLNIYSYIVPYLAKSILGLQGIIKFLPIVAVTGC